MVQQSRKVQQSGRQMRQVTGANRPALGTRHARSIRNGDGEPTADEEQGETREREMEGIEVEKDVTMSETTAEIEMGAAASNNWSTPALLPQVLHLDHGSAGDGS